MINVTAYAVESFAPHQNMMIDHLRAVHGDCIAVTVRTIPRSVFGRMVLFFQVFADTILRRKNILYFSSFVSVSFALVAVFMCHPRWIYHSQDWIQDQPGEMARIERWVVRWAPIVLWNETTRARAMCQMAGRELDALIVPTYLPEGFQIAHRSQDMRRQLADRAGIDYRRMVAIFAGGSYSHSRLSPQLLIASEALDVDTVIIFSGPIRIADQQVKSNILDVGLLPYDEMMAIMASCDIGLLLYDYAHSFGHRYQQPGRLTEYLCAGLSLVATPFPDAERLMERTDFCLVVDGYNTQMLASALKEMTQRTRHDSERAERIRNYSIQHMTYEPGAEAALRAIRRKFSI
jgi:hypothetical protein